MTRHAALPTLLQHVLIEYVILTSLEGPAPERNHRTRHYQERSQRCRHRRCRRRRRQATAAAADGGDGGGGGGGAAATAAATVAETTQHWGKVTRTRPPSRSPRKRPAVPQGARRRRRGERRSEPFVGRLIPWHNCHGGAWNKTLLITHTRVRIE